MIPNIPVKGIFHGAGVLDTALYMDMTEEKIEKVLRPKVLGTLNLHRVSRRYVLDYFVMHSSIASILGNISNSNYAAANSFLDGMAHFRRTFGLPGQSINWGGLDVGMAKDNDIRSVLVDMGFNILDVENIKSCFIASLLKNAIQVSYSKFDWARLSENLSYRSHVPLKFRVRDFLPKTTTQAESLSNDLDHDSFHTKNEAYTRLKNIVRDTTAEVLKIDKEDILDNMTLVDLGMDSQQGIEFARILEQRTGCRVPFVFMISSEFVIVGLEEYIFETLSNVQGDINKGNLEFKSLVRSMTYAESEVYKNVIDQNECLMFIKFDFKLCKAFSLPGVWRTILQWLLSVHPELRTIYRISEEARFSVEKMVLPYDETIIDFRITKGTIDDTTDIEYNPSKDLPINVILYHKNKQPFIRFMINSIASDLKNCIKIFSLISTAVVSFYTQRELPSMPFLDPIDFALKYEEMLESKRQGLKDYWKEYLNCPIESASFHKLKRKSNKRCENGIISRTLSDSIYCRLQHYINELDISCMQLFTCLYQLLLYCTFHQSSIGIRAKVYVKDYPVEFKDRIWNSSNYIPIILEEPKEGSINAFIKTNSENIQRCIMRSEYPFDLILKDNEIDPDTFCHEIAVEDVSPFESITDYKEQFSMHLHNLEIGCARKECSLLVLQRDYQHQLTINFSFGADTFKHREAEQFMDDLFKLLLMCLDKPGTKNEEIHLETQKLMMDCAATETETTKGNAIIEVTKL